MTTDPSSLLRRYRETRDPELLGRLFDATAPRLLRLAIHLAGDAADAEDLVQATFLAVIEGAERFEPGAEVMPWLCGILANKAKYARRSAARPLDPERLERLSASPIDEASHAELSGELAKALDRLEETYRQPLLLRLRHGMKTADIAHVLGLSPGAVRVRLSRGMARLRQTLPAGLASSMLLFAPERGLAALRAAVVAEAAASVVTGTSILTLGGVLVTKKTLLCAAALAIAVLVSWWYRAAIGATRPSASAPAASEVVSLAESGSSVRAPAPAEGSRAAPEAAPPTSTATLTGLVIDAATGAPLADVLVEVYPRETMRVSELKRRDHPFLFQDPYHGGLLPLATWPRPVYTPRQVAPGITARNLTDAQLTDQEPVIVATRPLSTSSPVASSRSDAQGRFQVPRPDDIGVLVCSFADYGRRVVPVMEPPAELVVRMRRERILSGHLIDTDGERIEAALELLFYGPLDRQGDLDTNAESWIARTEPDGSFAVALAAKFVFARSLTPGWLVVDRGMHPEHRQRYVFPGSYEPGEPFVCACGAVEPVRWVLRRVPVLRITAADTGEPIEHFEMTMRELRDGYVRWAGRYYARGGIYDGVCERGELERLAGLPVELTVWAQGYRACTTLVADLLEESEVRFALERGRIPSLTGGITEGGRAIAGARVSIRPRALLWSQERRSIDATLTDELGRFELSAPEGDYVLMVEVEEREHMQPVTLAQDTHLAIDLARLAEVVVEVRDTMGVLQVDHAVAIGAEGGRSQREYTSEDGCARFGELAPGRYKIHVPNVSTRDSFVGGVVEYVELAEYGRETVSITVPAPRAPVQARIVTDVPQDFAHWRAKEGNEAWLDVLPDGTIPIDLNRIESRLLEVAAPDRRGWRFDVPDPVPDGFEVRIVLGGPKYTGVLRSLVSGEPMARVTVHAGPARDGNGWPDDFSAVSDWQGRFTLDCAEAVPHRLRLSSVKREVGFIPASPPGFDPTPLEIHLPPLSEDVDAGLARKTIRGSVRRGVSGTPVAGARAWIAGIQGQAHGTLEWHTGFLTDGEGHFVVTMPDMDTYRVNVYDGGVGARVEVLVEEWAGVRGRDETRDLTIP